MTKEIEEDIRSKIDNDMEMQKIIIDRMKHDYKALQSEETLLGILLYLEDQAIISKVDIDLYCDCEKKQEIFDEIKYRCNNPFNKKWIKELYKIE